MDIAALQNFVNRRWDESIVPTLMDYIRIPNKSPAFDPDWQAHGFIDQVIERFHQWALDHPLRGMQIDVVRLAGRTPLLKIDVAGQGDDCVLMYGHLDKQPEMAGWSQGLGPWQPVIRGDKLYGRGAADDGYAMFAGLSALAALQEQGIPHARCVMLIEACEESGSYDLPPIIEHLGDRIGNPSLVVALDSDAATMISCGAPPPCAVWSAAPCVSPCLQRAFIQAMLGEWCRAVSESRGCCCRGSRTNRPGRFFHRPFTVRYRRRGKSRLLPPPRFWTARCTANFPLPAARVQLPAIRQS